MKRLKLHWSARPLSCLLSAVLTVLPVLLLWLTNAPMARAQSAAGASTANSSQALAVLDFSNTSGYGGGEVGRLASDAFVVELGKSSRYNALTRKDTQAGLAELGLTPPLDVTGIQKLGRDRAVDAVATGEIASVSFTNNPRQAKVSLVIRMTDSASGELVNGALSTGTSNPRAIATNDDDTLVNEAISNAAFAAVKQISQFNLPKATVLIARDQDSVVLNKGSRDGMYNGLNMVVTRNGSLVGRVRVSNVSSDQSDAGITVRGLGIRPEDRATAIYALPAYTISTVGGARVLQANNNDISSDGTVKSSKRNAFSGIGGVLLAILAGALLISLIRRGSSDAALGGAEVGKPSVAFGRSDDSRINGGFTSLPISGLFAATGFGDIAPTVTNYVPVAARITATTGNINPQDFVEYHVYRNDEGPFLTSGGYVTIGSTTTTTAVPTGFGEIPIFSVANTPQLNVYDTIYDKVIGIVNKPLKGGQNATTLATVTITGGAIPGSQAVFGRQYQYLLEALWIQNASPGVNNPGSGNSTTGTNTGGGNTGGGNTGGGNTGGGNTGGNSNTGAIFLPHQATGTTGGNTGGGGTAGGGGNAGGGGTAGGGGGTTGHGITYQLTGRRTTNTITFIEPVDPTIGSIPANLATPITNQNPTSFQLDLFSSIGANDYVLEVANNLGFNGRKRYSPTMYIANNNASLPNGAGSLQFKANVQADFGIAAGNTLIYYRVGARDTRNGTDEGSNPYIYSNTTQFGFPSSVLGSVRLR